MKSLETSLEGVYGAVDSSFISTQKILCSIIFPSSVFFIPFEMIVNLVNTDVNPKNSPDNIFSRREIEEDVIRIAERNGFNRFCTRRKSYSLE
jgi:hypothetical protein